MKHILHPLIETYKNRIPPISTSEIEAYEIYFDLLQGWNEKMALVSKNKILEAFSIHFIDSIYISDFVKPFGQSPYFDIGSGAGFPGLVFAIRNPDKKITLLEKAAKKRLFLNEVVTKLQLKNVRIGEIVPQDKVGGVFLARAVRPPEELVKWLRKVLTSKSILAVNYGGAAQVMKNPGGFRILEEYKYSLPQGQGDRKIQILEKV